MSATSIAINARFPVVWADPQTLIIGFDPPRVILREVQDDLLVLLHHLTSGISESGLRMFANTSGVSDKRLHDLLDQLAPVLAPSVPAPRREIVLDATPGLSNRALQALASIGSTAIPFGISDDTAREVLILAHFVPDPAQFTRWLRRDQPHTPVIFTDQAITVGPRIMPGETACLHCELTDDQALPWSSVPIVSQLWGRAAPTATPENITRATWHANSMIEHVEQRYQLRISPTTGDEARTDVLEKPGCGCRGLS